MDFLRLPNWEVIDLEEKKNHFLIRAKYNFQTSRCQHCQADVKYLHRYGIRIKTIKDLPMQGKFVLIELSVQRYKCLSCRKTFTQKVSEIADHTRITQRLINYIERQPYDETNLSVSRQTGVNENKIRAISTDYANNRQKTIIMPTPEILGMDGVYVGGKERCILTDIKNKRFIELHKRVNAFNINQYILDLHNKENIKVVVMDMSKAFKAAVREILDEDIPIVIDKYHIQRTGNRAVSKFLQKIRRAFIKIKQYLSEEERKQYFPDRFILKKRSYDLSEEKWQKLEEWGRNFPDLVDVYNLKEEFLQIWNYTDRQKAEKAFDDWRDKIPSRLRNIFSEALTAFKNWREEIFNYFDYPFTNAFTESMNNLIKMIQRRCRGASYETVRVKMLNRAFDGLAEDEKQAPVLNNYRYMTLRKQQRTLQLQQGRLNTSKVFGLMFPQTSSFLDRFAPHVHLFYKKR